MGYHSRVKGHITFSPGISVDELRQHPVLRNYEDTSQNYADLLLSTFSGELVDCIESTFPDEQRKNYELENNLKEIVAALPGRKFSGRLEIYGEGSGDIYGLRVVNGEIKQIDPELVWPED